jgi:hypothetical protein
MITALIISGIILFWYCVKELRNSEPNWPKAINMAIFWPLSLIFNVSPNKKSKQ